MTPYPNPYRRIDPLTWAYLQNDQLARTEGEERYLDSIYGMEQLRGRSLGDIGNYGKSFEADINARSQTNLNNLLGDLASRGLSNSSLRSSVVEANNRQKNAELRRLNDDLINRRIQTDERLSNNIYGQMERRTDAMPNANTLAQLSQGLGYAGNPYIAGQYQNPYTQPGRPMIGGRPSPAMGVGAANPYIAGGYAPPPTGANLPGGRHGLTQAPMPYAPATANGLDSPYANALSRYQNRQQAMYSPYGMAGGMMGGMYGGAELGSTRSPNAVFADPNALRQPTAATMAAQQQDSLREQMARNDNQAYQSQFGFASPKQQFSNFKSNPIARQYPGFGANMWNEMPAQLAPATNNLGYTAPAVPSYAAPNYQSQYAYSSVRPEQMPQKQYPRRPLGGAWGNDLKTIQPTTPPLAPGGPAKSTQLPANYPAIGWTPFLPNPYGHLLR